MNQGIWKIYKSKVLKNLSPEQEEEDIKEQSSDTVTGTPLPMPMPMPEEGSTPVSQLAKKMQGVSVKGWKCMSSLFNKEDEHKLLTPENSTPVEHVLSEPAPAPEAAQTERKVTSFWDTFAIKWSQAGEANQGGAPPHNNETEEATEGTGTAGVTGGGAEETSSSNDYTNLEGSGDSGFKWNFVTSKLAELKSKSLAKNN
ncbi:uncharacterized protein C1orf232 [Callorhinchus milii]|uniref:Testis development-related protein-like n=1 Tax=Callorhinchus milii TaxID=7868 RepID=V9L8Y5_CALMI|nr:uncharacterized protein C1orf232 [Callorhinchus milii]|eukprot:gi/632954629/ref/XP_007893063.1/ PREDICTED: testis development-related protein-like [Callorhinchus milii]